MSTLLRVFTSPFFEASYFQVALRLAEKNPPQPKPGGFFHLKELLFFWLQALDACSPLSD
ncbi:MAG: hypothetical protein K9J76_00930 [Polaromonas sp.]|nr:hypothetical protein [Polaromonas sp.]